MTEETRYCLWCGTELSPFYDGLYCNDGHRKKQQRWRQKLAETLPRRCPHPGKIVYTHRGLALRAAVHYRQFPYLCRCGVFHLSSNIRPGDECYDVALRALMEEMLVSA